MKPVLAAAILALLAPAAFAESQGQRDERRASYIEGFSCWVTAQGQSVKIEYERNGSGTASYEAGQSNFSWKVSGDKFCRKFQRGEEQCVDLPGRDIGDEERKFKEFLQAGCL